MHRFYLPPEKCGGPELTLDGSEAHHAAKVLRLAAGDPATVLDGVGHEFSCTVVSVAKNAVVLAVREKKFVSPNPWRISLAQAIPKGKLFDSIVQKAAELGTFAVIPLLTERVISQLDDDRTETKLSQWRSTAVESIKQCGSGWLSRVDPPMKLEELLPRTKEFDLVLVASLHPGSEHPRYWFQEYESQHHRPPQSVLIWVGPEGDFTPNEISAIVAAGARPMTLGRWVLRCETAAIYSLSVINHELQLLNSSCLSASVVKD